MMLKNTHLWLPEYLRTRSTRAAAPGLRHLIFCMVDHYEPDVGGAPLAEQLQRVERWVTEYPRLVSRHRDADGRPPRYSFFYPVEAYQERVVARLAALCRDGLAEIEIHLHHDGDTGKTLAAKLEQAKADLLRHGLLARDRASGRVRFGFIHGNWALDNSRPDGKWCGVNNELTVLQRAGCYGDFTMPSAPSATQTRKINSLYYATDDPDQPKSHDSGRDAAAGSWADGGLLMIQGPLTLNWRRRKFGLLPRIENGELSQWNPPTAQRADLWVGEAIGVRGKPDWVFVKVFTHGAKPGNDDVMLGPAMDALFTHLERRYNDGTNWKLHYATAREMYNLVKAAERGKAKDPGQHLDEELLAPMGRA